MIYQTWNFLDIAYKMFEQTEEFKDSKKILATFLLLIDAFTYNNSSIQTFFY